MDLLDFFVCYPAGKAAKEMGQRSSALAKRMAELNRKRKGELAGLRSMVARLMLVVETQQRLLLQKGVFSGPEFDALLQSVDAEDGNADGQLNRS